MIRRNCASGSWARPAVIPASPPSTSNRCCCLLGERANAEADWHYVCPEGARVPVHVSLTALQGDNGEITGYLATAYDISERKKLTDSITFLAQHDALTGLPNRMKLRQRLEQALERAGRLEPAGCGPVDRAGQLQARQ